MWYWQLGDEGFRVLTAKNGNEYIGQSCAYRVKVCVGQDVKEMWWGVDAFVLEGNRGRGIGSKLQEQMHHDLPNFTSAWYSPTNGAIKRKCGSHGIMEFPFAYYPVSSYYSILLELGIERGFHFKIKLPRIRLPWFYSTLNKPCNKQLKGYEVIEMSLMQLPMLSVFAESCLKEEPFHVIRSEQYLQWKYVDNPRTRCRLLSISKNHQLVGLVVFSELLKQNVVHAKSRVVKIYDSLLAPFSGLTHKQMLFFVADYLRNCGERIDGFKSLQKTNWHPSLLYPKRKVVLSTMNTELLPSGYITYMDQDMEG